MLRRKRHGSGGSPRLSHHSATPRMVCDTMRQIGMCRNIKPLFNVEPPVNDAEYQAVAARLVTGFFLNSAHTLGGQVAERMMSTGTRRNAGWVVVRTSSTVHAVYRKPRYFRPLGSSRPSKPAPPTSRPALPCAASCPTGCAECSARSSLWTTPDPCRWGLASSRRPMCCRTHTSTRYRCGDHASAEPAVPGWSMEVEALFPYDID